MSSDYLGSFLNHLKLFKKKKTQTRVSVPVLYSAFEVTGSGHFLRPSPHQVVVVLCFIQGAGVREEQHLRVGVDAEVQLH